MILRTATPFSGIKFKVAFLVAIPLIIYLYFESRKASLVVLRSCLFLLLMPLLYTVVFGNRLWAQHFAPSLPLFYCCAAIAYDKVHTFVVGRSRSLSFIPASLPVACIMLLIAGLNTLNMRDVRSELRATGGVGLMSDAINRFSEDARDRPSSIYIFPDWGLHMGFAMITGGASEIRTRFDPGAIRKSLSLGRDVVLATIGEEARDRRDRLINSSALPAPVLSEVYQRNGIPIIFVATWRGEKG
jgi:hypothetical protein